MSKVELPFESRFYSAPDGLKLHVREYGSMLDPGVPLVCLAGLNRNSADFCSFASALAAGLKGAKRRVLALDYRGRGLSGYDRDWKNYSLEIENADVLSVLAATEIEAAIFIGTSRGGLHTMLLTATRPAVIRGAVLNDIGPVLEPRGMARIRGYVGRLPVPRSIPDAADLLKEMMSERFKGGRLLEQIPVRRMGRAGPITGQRRERLEDVPPWVQAHPQAFVVALGLEQAKGFHIDFPMTPFSFKHSALWPSVPVIPF